MLTLIVKQKTTDGRSKTWKLNPSSQPSTFGSSKLCALVSIDSEMNSYEFLIEFKNEKWNVISLNKNTVETNTNPSHQIEKNYELKFKKSSIFFEVIQKSADLFEQLEKRYSSTQKPGTTAHQLYVIKLNDKVLETKVHPSSKKYQPQSLTEKITVDPVPTAEWVKKSWKEYEISQKTVYLNNVSDLKKLKADQLVDKDSHKSTLMILGVSFLIGALAVFSPKNKPEVLAVIPQSATKILVRTDFKKTKEQKVEKQQQVAEKTPAAGVANDITSSGGGKVANLLKSSTSKISSLLAKISAQSAKSKNAMFGKGIVAGTAPAGRAIASLGPTGKNWGADTQGQGVTISTAGVGGGNSVKGMGSLQGGKIGQGGVGLIEDESEVVGGLDRDVIASYIKSQLGQILYCYERQLSANKDLYGKVAVKFTIGSSGQVETQNIGDTTLKNATVEGCILNKVAQWKFPAPQGGTKVNVTYPFLFKSTN